MFQKSKSHFKIVAAIRKARSKVQTVNPQILGAIVQNLVELCDLTPKICASVLMYMKEHNREWVSLES
jgi:hypothetical protein